jgi:predicted membrane GTPase involved in stress response
VTPTAVRLRKTVLDAKERGRIRGRISRGEQGAVT